MNSSDLDTASHDTTATSIAFTGENLQKVSKKWAQFMHHHNHHMLSDGVSINGGVSYGAANFQKWLG